VPALRRGLKTFLMDDVYARYRVAMRLGHHEAAEGRFAEALGHYQCCRCCGR